MKWKRHKGKREYTAREDGHVYHIHRSLVAGGQWWRVTIDGQLLQGYRSNLEQAKAWAAEEHAQLLVAT